MVIERRTEDGRFGYEEAGDAGAPPLVFLHGIGGAARGWRRQLTAFAPDWHAVAWDMPGYGTSAALSDVPSPRWLTRWRRFWAPCGWNGPCWSAIRSAG